MDFLIKMNILCGSSNNVNATFPVSRPHDQRLEIVDVDRGGSSGQHEAVSFLEIEELWFLRDSSSAFRASAVHSFVSGSSIPGRFERLTYYSIKCL